MSSLPPELIIRRRFLGFLIWQSILSTSLFIFFKFFLLSPLFSFFSSNTSYPVIPFAQFFTFITFQLSQLLYSCSLAAASSPWPVRPASSAQLGLRLARVILISGESQTMPPDFRRRVKVLLSFVLFVAAAAVAGFFSVGSLCWVSLEDGMMVGRMGIRGFAVGLLYGLFYVYNQRWILQFPIIQRPPFFSFKIGLPTAIVQALKLSSVAFFSSALLLVFLPEQLRSHVTAIKFVGEQIVFYVGGFTVLLCWEMVHHLHQVLHTKRFMFAPPKGSAAAETNPSELLLSTLEESDARSLLQYLAYLDLCMICENNVDTWRRAAFFEETGETYRRVMVSCLKPLEELASKLAEGLESSTSKSNQLSHQLQPSTEHQIDPKYYEPVDEFQLSAWCARTAASLTAHSHKEDRFGVAQLSGSNASVISTLISCLLAVETLMGKKTNLQSSNQLMGAASIKWATLSTSRRDSPVGIAGKKKGGPVYAKAYAMADVLRTSIYHIVSSFHDEMMTSGKSGHLEKDWIISDKPLYGTRELLLQKLRLFLDFQAC